MEGDPFIFDIKLLNQNGVLAKVCIYLKNSCLKLSLKSPKLRALFIFSMHQKETSSISSRLKLKGTS
jgi:hypothetical protein